MEIATLNWVYILELLLPGTVVILGASWLIALPLTQAQGVREAHRLTDSHGLTGEDRGNYLEWQLQEQGIAAAERVIPATIGIFVVLMAVSVLLGLTTCSVHVDEDAPRPKGPARPLSDRA